MEKSLMTMFVLMGVATLCSGDEFSGTRIDPFPIQNIIESDGGEDVEEPCKGSSDFVKCVQEYLKSLSRCRISEKIDDTPVMFKDNHHVFIPVANMSYILTDTNLTMNAKITEFYVNHATSNLVMTVDFEEINVVTKNMKVIVDRVGREPKIVTIDASGTHHIITTAVIPIENTITLDALSHAYISTYIPSYDLSKLHYGSKFTNSDDPAVAESAKALFENISPALGEYFLTAGPDAFMAYLQKYICNFGLAVPY